jgi:hypothetical protein
MIKKVEKVNAETNKAKAAKNIIANEIPIQNRRDDKKEERMERNSGEVIENSRVFKMNMFLRSICLTRNKENAIPFAPVDNSFQTENADDLFRIDGIAIIEDFNKLLDEIKSDLCFFECCWNNGNFSFSQKQFFFEPVFENDEQFKCQLVFWFFFASSFGNLERSFIVENCLSGLKISNENGKDRFLDIVEYDYLMKDVGIKI